MKQFLTSEQIEILNKEIKFTLPHRVVSLGDLLEILPEVIYHEGKEYSRTITKSIIQYCCEEEGECLEITDEYENCQELIDNLFHTCLSLKDTNLLNTDNSSGYKFEEAITITESKRGDISDFGILDTSDLLSYEELCDITIKHPEKFSDGIYRLPVDFLNTTREDYKKIVGKCFIFEYDKSIVIRIEDLISPQYSEFLYEQYDQHSDNTWNCKDYIWLQNTAAYDPEYKKYCLTDQTEMNIGSEDMFYLGKDGYLYTAVDCGGAWYRWIPFDSDKFEKIKEEALKNKF